MPAPRRVLVRRYDGDLDMPVSVSYATKDGTAVAGIDYKPAEVRGPQAYRSPAMDLGFCSSADP